LTPWAGDIDLSLPLGNAQYGTAMLTLEISVGLSVSALVFLQTKMILNGLYHLQEALVLASALIDPSGITTEAAPDHQPQRYEPQDPEIGDDGKHQQNQRTYR
jgi:hypothetical protein